MDGLVVLIFAIFTAAGYAAMYFAWRVPAAREEEVLGSRLRELRARVGSRKTASAADLVRRESRGRFAFLGDFVSWLGVLRRMQEYIDQADLKYRAADVAGVSLVMAAAVYLLLGLAGMDLVVLRGMLALGAGSAPMAWVMMKRRARLSKFEQNLPDAIDLFNRSMKAGHNIHSGLETMAAETFDPVKMEFRKVVEELALGSTLEAALHSLGKRVPLIDLKFFITGLILQRQTGANMVEVLENLGVLIRERLNLHARMKAATAQQRLSAALLCSLPVVMAVGFWFIKPDYLALLYTDPTGRMFLTYAVVSELVGILVIRKIASPRF